MKSIRELYKIGRGPSSSHTMGPYKAASLMKKRYPDAVSFRVTLYGSLAFTGKGHLTDQSVIDAFAPLPCEVIFDYISEMPHVNTFDITINFLDKESITHRIFSLGGGAFKIVGEEKFDKPCVYLEKNFSEIITLCQKNNWRLYDYVEYYEGKEIWSFLKEVWEQMQKTIEKGLNAKGLLPGKLKIYRRAKDLYAQSPENEDVSTRAMRLMSAYAFATGEENASGGVVVTSPTCGSAGTLPALLKFLSDEIKYREEEILQALATAAVIGNVVKHNASISGAEAGCQAEIGTACSMSAAAYAELLKYNLNQIEVAAEIALEHNLGLTCDPIGGYVQIPCIERNAIAVNKAITSTMLAQYLTDTHAISFDLVTETMLQTGKDLGTGYRETAKGGLANLYAHLKKKHQDR